ncbi:hypothetical protein [Natrinema sp. 1APR25-10V2]|uniref:hypothetical protein n=1 Tax=Natrinema sp. 1APR25-10V2 TaxID=2951081 RepID=UPI002876B486|nr:hypothetical protein [Natrinema sp. 1APR25-10V2]MDS0476626.1 hypothetical protein [Natrinema sp. 1APR25-10V2]
MSTTFTHDEIEKTVENADGETIGTIAAVEGNTARIEPRAGIVNSIKARLGWKRGGEETVVIHEDAVDEITGEAIRLEAESVDALESDRQTGANPTERAGTESTEGGGTVPERETGIDEQGRETGVDESADAAHGADVEPEHLATRDRGNQLAEEMSEAAKRDTGDVTDEPLRGDAAERADESSASDDLEEADGRDGTAETGEAETEASPDARSELRSTESHEPADRASDRDAPTRANAKTEPTDETSLVDELDRGPDIESAVDPTDSGGPDEDDEERTATEGARIAAEIDPGVDIESAAEPSEPAGSSNETESMALADELDRGPDIESAVESDRQSELTIDPDTVAGGRNDAETGAGAAAREIVREDIAATERTSDETTDGDEPSTDAGEETGKEYGRERRRSRSPLGAMISAQTAMIRGQEAFQRDVARGAIEAPLLVQRTSLAAARVATQRYVDAVTAGTGTGESRERRRSLDEAVARLEDVDAELDEEPDEGLTARIERIQELQARLDETAEFGSEPAATIVERQVELLEECQRRLNASHE